MGGLYSRMEGKIQSPPQGADTAVWLALEVSVLFFDDNERTFPSAVEHRRSRSCNSHHEHSVPNSTL